MYVVSFFLFCHILMHSYWSRLANEKLAESRVAGQGALAKGALAEGGAAA